MSVDFRIVDFNYPFKTNVGITASSEDSNFPATNLRKHLRSKVWRSSGNFVIDTTNNKLNFNEGGGELTATITSGTYTPTTLAAEIKTQLDAAGAETYSVEYGVTTGKWSITTGGSTLSLLFGTGTDIATDITETIGFAASDYTAATTYTGAHVAIHTEESVEFDLKSTEEIDTFAIVFDPTIDIKFSDAAVIKLQGSATSNWTSPPVDVTLSIDDNSRIITHFFTSDQVYRYWRISIVDPKNANLYVELPKVILGESVALAAVPQIGFSLNYRDTSDVDRTPYGHEYFDVYPIAKDLDFNFNLLTNAQMEVMWNSFNRVGTVEPVFVALDTAEEIFDKDRMSIYGRYERDLSANHIVRDRFQFALSIREAF